MTRDREPFVSFLLYHAFKWSIVSPLLHTYWQGRIYGTHHVPKKGAFLVVSNHASNYDPLFLSCCVGRPVAYMAKKELFSVPVLSTAIQLYGAYPVNRSQVGASVIKAALEYLENGWGVGVFMDGTRTPTGRITEPKSGAAMIAAKAQVPVLPVSMWGMEKIEVADRKFPVSTPVTLRIGELQPPPASSKRADIDQATADWTALINKMQDLGR